MVVTIAALQNPIVKLARFTKDQNHVKKKKTFRQSKNRTKKTTKWETLLLKYKKNKCCKSLTFATTTLQRIGSMLLLLLFLYLFLHFIKLIDKDFPSLHKLRMFDIL
jgi:hypothetical protein